ncbi:Eco57I restriction-modification methylase domain-containing protein [Anaeromyxobacter terrae]|uniref:Eco57I restriction-modification methylase domain-containing protein n=1 Tax=Anaeromyxobacter terrae TaxID=2925406 RepID=UPI001F59A75A|nr:N-6 DNA methylase [Anaeromyxobacter sp. SG22]
MAPRRRRDRDVQIAFEALTIEGGLLSPEWLARVAQLLADQQGEADYRIPKGLNVRDEIGRYWRIAQAHWAEFAAGKAAGADPKALAERFVTALLREAFGFASLAATGSLEVEGRMYPLGHVALGGRVPVVIGSAGSGLDRPNPVFGDGARRRSAFGLAQEYLNASDGAMWGIASDGVTLRVLRDNASLTRPTWLEADLERIFTETRYADFAALWLVAHETRFGRHGTPAAECALEAWRAAGREEGTRAREHLRNGVEDALVALGTGFLAHPGNAGLREALHAGNLTTQAYFQELLRLVYRIIFLLTVEERGVLHPDGADEAQRKLYADGYALRRVRDRSLKRSAHDRFSDLWEGLKVVLRGVATGEPRLALPALGGIFAAHQCPHLDSARLENRAILLALFKLSWLREDSGLSRVNWRDMGPEELGSVYESLLELVPRIVGGGRGFTFATGAETKGNARKTTGSYYTPDSLVQVLLDTALEPVVQQTIAANPASPAEALLRLAIVDPACGSGHFLLAAARRLAAQVARLQAEGTPLPAEYRHALRQVISRCVFGVDVNPMAVELCRVSLWMEAVEPGQPLSFLDSHVQRGNALLGATPELMKRGVPDAAFEPIEGDDKKTASLLKKKNKAAAEGQRAFDLSKAPVGERESAEVAKAVAALDEAPDADLAAVASKEARWEDLRASAAYRHQRLVADAWCAAFVWPKPPLEPKKPSPIVEAAPTNELWRQIRDGRGQPPLTEKSVQDLSSQYRFFHWHLAFPQIFARGGFDVVIGNPPWERVKLQEQEFFASRSPEIADAPNAASRKKLISALPRIDPALWSDWKAASREAEGQSHLARNSGRFPLCGKGDVNTYTLFAEHNRTILGPSGRAGFIVPTGIATDDTTKEYFCALVDADQLRSIYDFENKDGIFVDVARQTKFSLLTIGSGRERADLLFFAYQVADLSNPLRHFSLAAADFRVVNPNTRTCPTFRSGRDANINLALYRRVGVLWREQDPLGNPWALRFMTMFHMANDSELFRSRADLESSGCARDGSGYVGNGTRYLPLIEGKMLHHFDHRYGDYADRPAEKEGTDTRALPDVPLTKLTDPYYSPSPRYWVAAEDVSARLGQSKASGWLLGWRDVSKSYNERTVVASVLPCAAVGHKFPLMMSSADPRLVAALYANLCALPFDYTARQKVGGTSLTYFILKQLPVLRPEAYTEPAAWGAGLTVAEWLRPHVLELTYTAWDLEGFANDLGYGGPPFRWDPDRRFALRCELDAAFFHLYGISHEDAEYILDTFPIVRKNDEKAYGEYRTKRVILEVYAAMADAIRTRRPYRTRLDPSPADPRVAHPPREETGRKAARRKN